MITEFTLLLIAALVLRIRELNKTCKHYHAQWSRWEHEYWYIRSIGNNSLIKLSWLEHGQDRARDESILSPETGFNSKPNYPKR